MKLSLWLVCGLHLMGMCQMLSAETLNISACPGNVQLLQNSNLKEPVLMRPTGEPAKAVQLQASPQGWTLRCDSAAKSNGPAEPAAAGQTVISGVQINRAIGPCAVAVQNIGGRSTVDRGEDKPSVVLQVPAGWKLLAKAWTGSLRAEGGVWTVDVELANGEMQFSKLHDSQVIVDVGSVTAQELTGRFVAHLRGAGSIEAAQMRDPALDLQLSGAGSMSLKGRAASARIRATGAGHIDIEHVTSEPWIQASGLATVDVGR
jgi:hypothetical protein